ncbi:hypothetical protein DPEC_G00355630 [Dallia pectoralis]|uniref:Uncharacterized protein n=1 Tax=Dallia pectoralis TaxID=75939 RepID=A0ACC2EZK8_DALPE|nr:hypothetical protein DPEC_G00355630 [Dallia pectoralis]
MEDRRGRILLTFFWTCTLHTGGGGDYYGLPNHRHFVEGKALSEWLYLIHFFSISFLFFSFGPLTEAGGMFLRSLPEPSLSFLLPSPFSFSHFSHLLSPPLSFLLPSPFSFSHFSPLLSPPISFLLPSPFSSPLLSHSLISPLSFLLPSPFSSHLLSPRSVPQSSLNTLLCTQVFQNDLMVASNLFTHQNCPPPTRIILAFKPAPTAVLFWFYFTFFYK